MRRAVLLLLTAVAVGGASRAGEVRFEERGPKVGIDFVHVNGAAGEKYMQETMGSGVAIFDADGDGDLDVYLVNGTPLPASEVPSDASPPTNRLFRNNGSGQFEDVTGLSGAGDAGYGMGVAVGDYDGDGDADLYVLNHGPNVLLRNRGDGTFEDVTAAAGVGDPAWSSSAVFFDAEGDGDLDLFVVNYCAASTGNHKWCGRKGREWRSYCTPQVYDAIPDTFYLNQGNGRFTEASRTAGLVDRGGKGLGVVPLDHDGDGDTDLHVANDSTPNQLWRNAGDGTFKEVGLLAGIAYSEDGRSEAGMGTDAGDVDGDGWQDLFVTNLDYETNALLRNHAGAFRHAGYAAGLAAPSLGMVGFGSNWLDADNDGDLDLLVANGHIIDNIRLYNDTLSYLQPNQMFVNDGNGRFKVAGPGAGLGEPNAARGSAVGDLDGDGRLDLVITRNGGRAGVFFNRTPSGGWLGVRLSGRQSNREGLGARIVLESPGPQVREMRSASSYQSAGPARVHFGLGQAGEAGPLRVRWPSGREENYPVAGLNREVTLVEGEGTPVSGQKSALRRGGPTKGRAPTGSGGWDRSVVLWEPSPLGK